MTPHRMGVSFRRAESADLAARRAFLAAGCCFDACIGRIQTDSRSRRVSLPFARASPSGLSSPRAIPMRLSDSGARPSSRMAWKRAVSRALSDSGGARTDKAPIPWRGRGGSRLGQSPGRSVLLNLASAPDQVQKLRGKGALLELCRIREVHELTKLQFNSKTGMVPELGQLPWTTSAGVAEDRVAEPRRMPKALGPCRISCSPTSSGIALGEGWRQSPGIWGEAIP